MAPILFQNMTVITISLRRRSPESSITDDMTIAFRCQVASHIPSWHPCWRSFPHSTGNTLQGKKKSTALRSEKSNSGDLKNPCLVTPLRHFPYAAIHQSVQFSSFLQPCSSGEMCQEVHYKRAPDENTAGFSLCG